MDWELKKTVKRLDSLEERTGWLKKKAEWLKSWWWLLCGAGAAIAFIADILYRMDPPR